MKLQTFFPVTKFDVKEILEIIKSNVDENKINFKRKCKVDHKGFNFNIGGLRLLTFYEKGIECVSCSRKGEYFSLERSTRNKEEQPHLNLYSSDGVLITKDHIKPKSKGGKDHLSNMQTMCYFCNQEKEMMND